MSRPLIAPLAVAFAVLQTPSFAADLTVSISGFKSANGRAICRLYNSSSSFPGSRALNTRRASISGNRSICRFKNLPKGRYAVAVAHDANGNGKMDKTIIGLPKEGFGFSRDAKLRFGPPSFSKAAFPMNGSKKTITLRMQYL